MDWLHVCAKLQLKIPLHFARSLQKVDATVWESQMDDKQHLSLPRTEGLFSSPAVIISRTKIERVHTTQRRFSLFFFFLLSYFSVLCLLYTAYTTSDWHHQNQYPLDSQAVWFRLLIETEYECFISTISTFIVFLSKLLDLFSSKVVSNPLGMLINVEMMKT